MIYIASPGEYVTGGTETLHQFASLLKSMGEDVGMYYIDPHTMNIEERFHKYEIKVVDKIEDNKKHILIVPETKTYLLKKYRYIRKCIWWLSKDFYLSTKPVYRTRIGMKKHHCPKVLFPVAWIWMLLKGQFHFCYYNFEDKGVYYHMYNCDYVHRYLLEQGVPEEKTLYLCGPLNRIFFEKASQLKENKRENIILYNPKKGIEFTQKLIFEINKKELDVECIPIQNLTPVQIANMMSRAKVYIDFGYFPGPERIPREAVTMGCNIITSKNGAAANDVDVPIPEKFKFENKKENIPEIIELLEDMLNNHDGYYHYYDEYREKVLGQVESFCENATAFLSHFQ